MLLENDMNIKWVLLEAALVLLFVQSAFAQTEDLSDTVWTKFTYPAAINAVKFTPDGKYLISGGSDSIPRLWDAETGGLIREFTKQNSVILDIDISSKLIAVASPGIDGVKIFNLNDYSLIKTLNGCLNLAFSSDGKYLITSRGETSSGITVFDTQSWEIIHQISFTKSSFDLCISPDNKYLARSENWGDVSTENKEGSIEIYSFPDLKLLRILEKKDYLGCKSLAFSPDGLYLAGAIDSSPNKIWNTSDWSLYKEFGSATDSKSITFSPDSRYILVGTGGFQKWHLSIWDINNGNETNSIKLDWLAKKYLDLDEGDTPLSISVDKNAKRIGIGGVAGIYMLNAKWNPTSVLDNQIEITEPVIFPNPANRTANIKFNLIKPSQIKIAVFDINSHQIANILDGFLQSGFQNFEWNVSRVPVGTYFARISANGSISTIKIIVNK